MYDYTTSSCVSLPRNTVNTFLRRSFTSLEDANAWVVTYVQSFGDHWLHRNIFFVIQSLNQSLKIDLTRYQFGHDYEHALQRHPRRWSHCSLLAMPVYPQQAEIRRNIAFIMTTCFQLAASFSSFAVTSSPTIWASFTALACKWIFFSLPIASLQI